MNTIMTENRKLKVEAAIDMALTETRRGTINECADAIMEQWKQYERLLDSKEARAILENTYGDNFQALYDKRRSLRSKQELLMTIEGKLYEIKWRK